MHFYFFQFLEVGWDWVHLVRQPINWPTVPAPDIRWWCGAVGGMRIGMGNWSTRRKFVPVPLCPSQNSHDLNRVRTQGAVMGSQRLNAWAMGSTHTHFGRKLRMTFADSDFPEAWSSWLETWNTLSRIHTACVASVRCRNCGCSHWSRNSDTPGSEVSKMHCFLWRSDYGALTPLVQKRVQDVLSSNFWLLHRLSWLRYFVVFLRPSR
jgi:hypothetical protein